MQFDTDETVSEAIAHGLRRRGFDVTTTNDANLRGASDELQLAFSLNQRRIMVSHDADMLRLAAAGTPHAGIAYCHNQKYKVGDLVLKLLALAGRATEEEMRDRVEFL
jgi:predicted nuclease of predicted toxin-antitoxin system